MTATPPPKRKAKKHAKLAIKIAISLVLVIAVYRKMTLHDFLQTLEGISLWTMLALMVLYTAGQCLSCWKWSIFVRAAGVQRSMSEYVRAYFFGMFINSFAFGTIGGDVARAFAVRPESGRRTAAIGTVLADRLHGLMILLAIGTIAGILVRPSTIPGWVLAVSAALVLSLLVGWILGPRLAFAILPENSRLRTIVATLAPAFPSDPRRLVTASCISFVFHSIQISMYVLMAATLKAPLSAAFLFGTVPFINAASTLPISVQGIGVREKMYDLLFLPVGVTAEQAVLFGAMWLLSNTIVSALGGLILTPDLVVKRDSAEFEAEMSEMTTFEPLKQERAVG